MAKPRHLIEIPLGRFTTKDLGRLNPHASAFVFSHRLREWIKAGQVKLVAVEKKPEGGKGLNIYEPVGL